MADDNVRVWIHASFHPLSGGMEVTVVAARGQADEDSDFRSIHRRELVSAEAWEKLPGDRVDRLREVAYRLFQSKAGLGLRALLLGDGDRAGLLPLEELRKHAYGAITSIDD